MIIRKMECNDYNKIYNMWKKSKEIGINVTDDSYNSIIRFIEYNPDLCIVATENNEIIGSILAGYDGRRGHIYHFIVKENNRNKGIGTILLNTVLNVLKDKGVSEVDLLAYTNNKHGNLFWNNKDFNSKNQLTYRRKTI